MESQFNECVNNELGVPPTLVRCIRNDEDVIDIDDDRDTSLTKEFPQLLPQSIECKGCVLNAKAENFELEDLSVPHETKILRVVWVNSNMIKS